MVVFRRGKEICMLNKNGEPDAMKVASPVRRGVHVPTIRKIGWPEPTLLIATLLWSSALSQINQDGTQVSFLTAIGFNIILAGSLLLTPFVVHALAGGGLSSMGKDLSSLAIGGMTISPSRTVGATKSLASKTISNGKNYFSKNSPNKNFNQKNQKHSANNKSKKQIKA